MITAGSLKSGGGSVIRGLVLQLLVSCPRCPLTKLLCGWGSDSPLHTTTSLHIHPEERCVRGTLLQIEQSVEHMIPEETVIIPVFFCGTA